MIETKYVGLFVRVEEEHREWIRKRAYEEKTSMSDIVRRLICMDMGVVNEEDS